MKTLRYITLCALGTLLGACSCTQDGVRTIEPQVFLSKSQSKKNAVVLDVRRPEEYAAGHLQGARNLDWLNPAAFEKGLQGLDKSRTYFVYCRSGKRSNAAAKRMKREGFKVYDLSGGYLKWTEQALPITK